MNNIYICGPHACGPKKRGSYTILSLSRERKKELSQTIFCQTKRGL
jgi:hypothetical protein